VALFAILWATPSRAAVYARPLTVIAGAATDTVSISMNRADSTGVFDVHALDRFTVSFKLAANAMAARTLRLGVVVRWHTTSGTADSTNTTPDFRQYNPADSVAIAGATAGSRHVPWQGEHVLFFITQTGVVGYNGQVAALVIDNPGANGVSFKYRILTDSSGVSGAYTISAWLKGATFSSVNQ